MSKGKITRLDSNKTKTSRLQRTPLEKLNYTLIKWDNTCQYIEDREFTYGIHKEFLQPNSTHIEISNLMKKSAKDFSKDIASKINNYPISI